MMARKENPWADVIQATSQYISLCLLEHELLMAKRLEHLLDNKNPISVTD